MAGVHIAHNCVIGDDNILANEVALAGHITLEDHVFISNNVGAHQFVRMGRYAMVGGKSKIVQDVLNFLLLTDLSARARAKQRGLRRAGFSEEARTRVERCVQDAF